MTREDYWIVTGDTKTRTFINERILTLAESIGLDMNAGLNELARAVYEEFKGAGVFDKENIDNAASVSKRVTFENIENRLSDDVKESVQKFENCVIDIEADLDKETLKRINSIGQGVIDKDDYIDNI